jgi:hypothetical protein
MRPLVAATLIAVAAGSASAQGVQPNPWGSRTLVKKGVPPTGLTQEDIVRNSPRHGQVTPPRVLVCVVIDQFRWDYIEKAWPALGPWGFRRMIAEGQSNLDCRYEYSLTVTAAGHATMMTGENPAVHGIVGNGWYDRATGRGVSNVGDPNFKVVDGTGTTDRPGASPHRLMVETVGDRLERATNGAAKTLHLSYKDRGAILMGGYHPDEVYWFDDTAGTLATSTYYMEALPEWVKDWTRQGRHTGMAGREWRLTKEKSFYEARCTPDDQPGESKIPHGRTFPKQFVAEVGPNYLAQFEASPFGDLYLIESAIAGMNARGIGRDEVPDLVTISLSGFDKAGHAYGPDSWEMLDFVLKEDFNIGKLLDYLDREVGEGQYTVLLCADHGIAPLVEVSQMRRQPAGRLRGEFVTGGAEEELVKRFGAREGEKTYIADISNDSIVLADDLAPAKRAEVAAALAAYLPTVDGFHSAWTRETVFGPTAPAGSLLGAVQASAHPARGGDVYFVLRPNFYMSGYPDGTTHGSPWEYDQRVPFLAFGRGFGKSSLNPDATELPEATSPRFMAEAARRVLGLD